MTEEKFLRVHHCPDDVFPRLLFLYGFPPKECDASFDFLVRWRPRDGREINRAQTVRHRRRVFGELRGEPVRMRELFLNRLRIQQMKTLRETSFADALTFT